MVGGKGRKGKERGRSHQPPTVPKISIAILWTGAVTPFCVLAHIGLGAHFSNCMKESRNGLATDSVRLLLFMLSGLNVSLLGCLVRLFTIDGMSVLYLVIDTPV